ncbi:MAG: type II toxin-antitoxin system VapB family antitoxin [Candidatus Latescibacterota bacterium]
MKTTIGIPEDILRDAMRFTGARTKREAIVTAVTDYNRRRRMAALTRHLGTCADLIGPEESARLRAAE